MAGADSAALLGRFHEISIETDDIRGSVEFYERLGFIQAATGDTWSHPYGVLSDGRVHLGLHERRLGSPSITYVRPQIARHAASLAARGIELELLRAGEEAFNEIAFRDPAGHRIAVLEARTYSPVALPASYASLCGHFSELSLPATHPEALRAFWEPLGFVASEETDTPYLRLPLTSDHLDLAFHRPRTFDAAMLVFHDEAMAERIQRLRARNFVFSHELPRGLDAKRNALLEAPEGTALLLLSEEL